MKRGFTLLEVLIATAIASMLMVSLFFSFNQINDSVRKASDTVDMFDAALLVDHILFKDVSGAFIPVQAIPPKETKKPAGDKKPSSSAKATADKDADEKAPEKESSEDDKKEGDQKSKVPLLKDAFMSNNKGDQMHMLTCITANPMRIFWGEKTGEPKPSSVRVVYSLEEKKDRKKKAPRYALYRQEGTKLDLALYTKKESEYERYLIADNIVSCKLKFIVADEKQEEKEEEKEGADAKKQPAKPVEKKEKKPEKELKEFVEWATDTGKKDVRTRLMLPDTVLMTLTLSNFAETRERSFTFRVPVAARFQEVPVQEPPRLAPGAQAAQKKPDAAAGAAQDKSKKEALVDGANKIVQNLRTKFGRA